MSSESTIKVFSPATIANVGCGYDIMGFALEGLGEEILVTKTEEPGLVIKEISGGYDLPMEPDKNLATIAVDALIKNFQDFFGGFEFELHKNIHPGSGLGTSASSSAGAVFAVNELLGKPFNHKELVEFAMEGEKSISGKAHADNVAPALLGGFVAVRGYDPLDLIEIQYPEDLHVAIIHPQIEVKTRDAKRMLKKQLDLSEATTQWGNVAGLVSGLSSGDYDLIGRSIQDVVAEPARSMLIPFYDKVKKKALDSGAYGCNISGSGPSIFAFTNSLEKAEEIKKAMLSIYEKSPIKALGFTSRVGKSGVRVI